MMIAHNAIIMLKSHILSPKISSSVQMILEPQPEEKLSVIPTS
jgi:hypothetical protein